MNVNIRNQNQYGRIYRKTHYNGPRARLQWSRPADVLKRRKGRDNGKRKGRKRKRKREVTQRKRKGRERTRTRKKKTPFSESKSFTMTHLYFVLRC